MHGGETSHAKTVYFDTGTQKRRLAIIVTHPWHLHVDVSAWNLFSAYLTLRQIPDSEHRCCWCQIVARFSAWFAPKGTEGGGELKVANICMHLALVRDSYSVCTRVMPLQLRIRLCFGGSAGMSHDNVNHIKFAGTPSCCLHPLERPMFKPLSPASLWNHSDDVKSK